MGTAANFDSLSDLFAAVRAARRPAVTTLETLCALPTFRALELGSRLRSAGLRAMCLGSLPTARGIPSTTIATCDAQVVSL